MQVGVAAGRQSSELEGRLAGPPAPSPQSGLQKMPKRHTEASEQHVISVLRQLLPALESEAVALTPTFDRALDVRLHPC